MNKKNDTVRPNLLGPAVALLNQYFDTVEVPEPTCGVCDKAPVDFAYTGTPVHRKCAPVAWRKHLKPLWTTFNEEDRIIFSDGGAVTAPPPADEGLLVSGGTG